jgi:CMP-N-acetylneuraminic acid synthetase
MISETVIDTDSPVIMEDARKNFPRVTLVERPQDLRSDTISMNKVLMHTVTCVDADYYLQTHSTNPLVSSKTIERAVKMFLDKKDSRDSLFSVTKIQKRLWSSQQKPVNHDPSVLLRTQDLDPLYEENSCIYIFSKDILLDLKTRIGKKPILFEMDPMEAWDIDDEFDFCIAEALYHKFTVAGE